MKVWLINYEFPPLGGGAGNATRHLGRELSRLGCGVTVITAAFSGLPQDEWDDGFRILRIPALRKRADRATIIEMLSFMFSGLFSIARLLRMAGRPDIALCFFGLPTAPIGLWLKMRFGIPYLVSLRGGDVPGAQPADLGVYYRLSGWLLRRIWREAAAVVANSRGLQNLALRLNYRPDIHMIPNGVTEEPFAGSKNRDSNELHLLFVGRVVVHKGLDVVLEALQDFSVPFRFTVVGDGPDRRRLQEKSAALGIADKVLFTGWQSREKVRTYYLQSDVLVFPSRNEGMPNVVLEAMAAGLPVLASDIPGNNELVINNQSGFLLPLNDCEAWRMALVRLAKNPELRQEMGHLGKIRARAEFSWESAAHSYMELFRTSLPNGDTRFSEKKNKPAPKTMKE